MSEPVDLINKKWFVKREQLFVNDDQQLYEIYVNHENSGQYHSIASSLTHEIAEHIVEIHNSWHTMKFLGAKIQGFFEEVGKSLNSFNDKLKNEGINKK